MSYQVCFPGSDHIVYVPYQGGESQRVGRRIARLSGPRDWLNAALKEWQRLYPDLGRTPPAPRSRATQWQVVLHYPVPPGTSTKYENDTYGDTSGLRGGSRAEHWTAVEG